MHFGFLSVGNTLVLSPSVTDFIITHSSVTSQIICFEGLVSMKTEVCLKCSCIHLFRLWCVTPHPGLLGWQAHILHWVTSLTLKIFLRTLQHIASSVYSSFTIQHHKKTYPIGSDVIYILFPFFKMCFLWISWSSAKRKILLCLLSTGIIRYVCVLSGFQL